MKNSKILSACFLLLSILIFTNCEININTDAECLQCSYTLDGRTISEEVCDPATEEEKQEMRTKMINEADSLGVTIDCFRN